MKRKIQFAPGYFYHIYNRGVAKSHICHNDNDYWRFLQGLCLFNDEKSATNILWQLEKTRGELTLKVLKDHIIANERIPLVRILAYCVMGNHFHLLIEELKDGGIVKFMHKLGLGYARYFNNKYDRVGSLFQGRFKAVSVENEKYLQYLLVYINILNPGQLLEPKLKDEGVKNVQNILRVAAEYSWSSHLDYLGKRGSIIINKGVLGEILLTPSSYLELVASVLRDKRHKEASHLFLE